MCLCTLVMIVYSNRVQLSTSTMWAKGDFETIAFHKQSTYILQHTPLNFWLSPFLVWAANYTFNILFEECALLKKKTKYNEHIFVLDLSDNDCEQWCDMDSVIDPLARNISFLINFCRTCLYLASGTFRFLPQTCSSIHPCALPPVLLLLFCAPLETTPICLVRS